MYRTRRLLMLFVLLAVGVSVGAAAAQPIATISVAGNNLIANGKPWVPHGVNVIGLVAPRPSPFPRYAVAAGRWGPAEIAAIKAYGADLVRFQVSQPGLDPQSPLYTPAYPGRIVAAVNAVRSAGMAVILSMQWERTSGMRRLPSMPDDSTFRAWQVLAPEFARDQGIMYELFNEPRIARGSHLFPPQRLALWTAAFQALINNVRSISTENVIIVDGLRQRITPTEADSLSDPAHRLAFAAHPYPYRRDNSDPQGWDQRFGDVARRYPVILTEWNSTSHYACQTDTPELVHEFLSYIQARRIGIVGHAFDVPGSLIKDFSFTPTNYADFHCGVEGHNGAGEALHQYFERQSRP
jgi:endoglucanase